jgi:hypothetical protein
MLILKSEMVWKKSNADFEIWNFKICIALSHSLPLKTTILVLEIFYSTETNSSLSSFLMIKTTNSGLL